MSVFWSRIHGPHGNNAFAYEDRKRTDSDPRLWIPPLQTITSISEVQTGQLPVFTETNEDHDVIYYLWLHALYQYSREEIPCFIFDNHNFALYFWVQYCAQSKRRTLPVIHIDQHSDLSPNSALLTKDILKKDTSLLYFVTHQCHVGNFIRPALDSHLISECIWIKNQYTLSHFSLSTEKFILDIDLDFRAPEMDTDLSSTIPMVQELMKDASLVTIATSPHFLDQKHALDLLATLFSY